MNFLAQINLSPPLAWGLFCAAFLLLVFIVYKFDEKIAKVEGYLLTFFLIVMIGLAFIQVFLRNLPTLLGTLHLSTLTALASRLKPFTWADAVARHLVLWVGFIGASVATFEKGHLAMDLVSRFLPEKLRKPTAMFVDAASSFVCALLTVAAYHFVIAEKEAETLLVPGVPNYWAIVIIPIGFAMMTLRFAAKIITDVRVLVKGKE